MSFRITALSIIILLPGICFGQSEDRDLIDQIIEYIAENAVEDHDYSEITERLIFYKKHPLDINGIQKEQLQELVFISPIQITNLLLHLKESGPFLNVLELQSIQGFDNETVRWLSNFLVVNPPALLSTFSFNKLISHGDHDLMIRFGRILQKQQGFLPSDTGSKGYAGSPDRIFVRYRFNYIKRISFSMNMDKDAGEPFIKNGGKGFDFYSANISLTGDRMMRKLVVGDYALQFGQGLTMWSGLGFGKGLGLTTAAKQAWGLRPYSSANESLFLRGAAATFSHKKISITPFLSHRKLDAGLSDDKSEINSISVSGLHRTATEQMNRSLVRQLLYGINSSYSNDHFTAGVTVYNTEFDKPLAAGTSLYERFNFRKQSLTNVGFHYAYTIQNAYLFGEAAHSLSSGKAFLNGLMASLSSQVSAVLLYRNYERNYHSFFNEGLAESTTSANEKGFYTGLNIKINPKYEFSGFCDFYRFPWLKFRVDGPSAGYELMTQLSYILNKKFKVNGRYRVQYKEENSADVNLSRGLETIAKQSFRIELNYSAGKSFSLRNRAEISTFRKGQSTREIGYLCYQDVIYNPLSSKFSGNMRFAIFDTPGFDSRIYAYENDVLYGYSIPAYQGKGLRFYLNGRYTLYRGADIWIRYALSSFLDQDTVGSGYDMISGHQRSDIKLQLRLQF